MADITVYGAPWCPDCKRSKKFLTEQRVPHSWVDIGQDADGLRRVEELQGGGRTIPTIVFADGSTLIEPTNEELAKKLGLTLEAKRGAYDLAIVGGGPAGLAAAIYAAREGIDSIVIERSALGGQAGITERVDNYPGFPDGIRGDELARRFIAQAQRYGVEMLSAVGVEHIAQDDDGSGDLCVRMGNGQDVSAHAVLIATGSTYRRLGVPGEDDGVFETSLPGVFVAGDVRRGSTKQLGSAVGEGIAALLAVRRHLEMHHDIAAHASD